MTPTPYTAETDNRGAGDTAQVEVLLFRGGGLFEVLERSTGLVEPSGSGRPLRAPILAFIAWAPLVFLAALQGLALGPTPRQSVLLDLAIYGRFLIALPLLLLAENIADQRFARCSRHFVASGLIRPPSVGAFVAAVRSVTRLRDSRTAEIVLLVLAFTGSVSVTQTQLADGAPSWRASGDAIVGLSLAGWWLVVVSQPLFQFILLRWIWRLVIWTIFLGRVSRLELGVVATHPDGAGGLAFLSESPQAFVVVVLAVSTVLACAWGNLYLHDGVSPLVHRNPFIAFVVLAELALLAPLLPFMAPLARVRREAQHAYAAFATRVANQFEARWIERRTAEEESFIERPDASALADLSAVVAATRTMKTIPFGTPALISIAVVAALPMLPLISALVPLPQLLGQLVKALL